MVGMYSISKLLREKKTRRNKIYLATQQLAQKRYVFDPLLTSSVLQASYKSQATAAKIRSLHVQRAIKLCERIKIQRETTGPRSSLKR